MCGTITSYYHMETEAKRFFIGDDVLITVVDGTEISGTISHISCKGVYIHTGKPRDTYFSFGVVREIKAVFK